MIYLLCSIFVLTFFSYLSVSYGDSGYKTRHVISSILGITSSVISLLACTIYIILIYNYVSADYKKDIINREYGTSYTQEEIFYADSVIDTIQMLHRNRIELKATLETKDAQTN